MLRTALEKSTSHQVAKLSCEVQSKRVDPMKVPPDRINSKKIEGPLAGSYKFHTKAESTYAYRRADGAFLVLVDTGRPEMRQRPRWYLNDGDGNFIGSLWRDGADGPEFDDRQFRYRIRRTGPDEIEVITLRPKGTRKGTKRGRGRGVADV